MTVDAAVQSIRNNPGIRDTLVHIEEIPARPAAYKDPATPFPQQVASALTRKGISLYTHQSEVYDHLLSGRNVVITTPTASGKTLAFSLPIFAVCARDPAATALLLYPAKALSNDQLAVLKAFEADTGIAVAPAVYDGDTPRDKRPGIRARSRIIVSNPHEVHHILPWHHQWSRFFKSILFVVIDEAHRYRGVTGSHIALLMRRLRRVCAHYGSYPLFVISTATLANPTAFAERLTGLPFVQTCEDGAPRGKRHFLLVNPHMGPGNDQTTAKTSSNLLATCLGAGLQTLCFTGSRRMAELIALMGRDAAPRLGDNPQGGVASYRAGYLAGERREIEAALKSGQTRGVVATNALELGIDIGTLDAVVTAGYPGSSMAVWQQAGRAGRGNGESLAILVAGADPLDQYFMEHPATFFSQVHESAVVDLDNPYITSGQVLCAAAELPLHPERDAAFFGPHVGSIAAALERSNLLTSTPRGWVYCGRRRATELVTLDGTVGETLRVVCQGKVIETMNQAQAYREAHEGAILIHRGERYRVDSLDLEEHLVRVSRTDLDYYTRPLSTTAISVQKVLQTREREEFSVSFGEVEVTEQYHAYRVLHYDRLIGVEPLTLPPLVLATRALWVTFDAECTSGIREGCDLAGALHGAEHALIGVMPAFILADRRDLGGVSTPHHPDVEGPVIFVYDGYPGGIGLAEAAYGVLEEVAAAAAAQVAGCHCQEGCPSCVLSPRCGSDNQPMDRAGAADLLAAIAGLQSTTRST
jgi:DEAD/DEAH box helicase domain-containing protein